MQHELQHETPPETGVASPVQPLDSNEAVFILRAQLKREKQAIESQLKAIDEDLRPAMLDGETFTDGREELYVLPVETTTFDWKAAIVAGVLTKEQAEPYLKRTLSSQIRSRKVEPKSTPPAEGTPEFSELRERLSKLANNLTGGA